MGAAGCEEFDAETEPAGGEARQAGEVQQGAEGDQQDYDG